jgi:hypothetical protein
MTARPTMPDTMLADRFLSAILRWAARQTRAERNTIPSGNVGADELKKVVVALVRARAEHRREVRR